VSLLAPVLAALLAQQPGVPEPTTAQPAPVQPTTQRPTTAQPTTTQPTPVQPAQPTTAQPTPAPAQPATAQPAQPTTAQPTPEPITGRPALVPLAAEPLPAPPEPVVAPVPEASEAAAPTAVAPVEPSGPPYYTAADMEVLRSRHGLHPNPPTSERRPVFRCWVADPTCGLVVEINATSAYAFRARQGKPTDITDVLKWNSARVQYDIWVSIPTMTESRGKFRYTRLSLGPKGGVVASDTKDVWGNVGIAGRYWFSRKRFAPNLEFTSALVFKVAGVNRNGNFDSARGALGFTADVGFGIGGFGSIVVGGQFDSALAREDIPEVERTQASGMFYIGFRGNILWGLPAAAAVGTHAAATRIIKAP